MFLGIGRHSSSIFPSFFGFDVKFFTAFASMMSPASSKTLPYSEDGLLSQNTSISTDTTSSPPR